jgi:catechol 2,3-dioxygenase-like lactoylglutathione lyase family enzyme
MATTIAKFTTNNYYFCIRVWLNAPGGRMLAAGKLIGFLITTDYDKARAFYEGKLGLEFVSLDNFALALRSGQNMIRITRAETFEPAQGTVLGWEVDDVRMAALWLRDRGVPTEKFPFVADQELGIWTAPSGDQVAWFKDPDGNVLSLSHHV